MSRPDTLITHHLGLFIMAIVRPTLALCLARQCCDPSASIAILPAYGTKPKCWQILIPCDNSASICRHLPAFRAICQHPFLLCWQNLRAAHQHFYTYCRLPSADTRHKQLLLMLLGAHRLWIFVPFCTCALIAASAAVRSGSPVSRYGDEACR